MVKAFVQMDTFHKWLKSTCTLQAVQDDCVIIDYSSNNRVIISVSRDP